MGDDIPVAKVEACTTAFHSRDEAEELVRITLRAAAAWDAEHGPDTSQDLTVAFQAGLRAGYDAALRDGKG
jgi:hypothetical protein